MPDNFDYMHEHPESMFEPTFDVRYDAVLGQYVVSFRDTPCQTYAVSDQGYFSSREEVSMPENRSTEDILNDPPVFEGIRDVDASEIPTPPVPGADNYLWRVRDNTFVEVRTTPCVRCGTQMFQESNVRDQMVNAIYARCDEAWVTTGVPELSGTLMMCASCARTLEYTTCQDCGEVYINPVHNDFMYPDVAVNSRYGYCLSTDNIEVCEGCSENYRTCLRCDEVVHNEDGGWFDDEFYCHDCLPEAREEYYDEHGNIQDYHSADKTDQFFSLSDEDAARGFMGIELEVENNARITDNQSMSGNVLDSLPYNLVVMERDGSLNSGFEIITKPMTYGYWMNVRDQWHDMLKMLADNGFRSHNGGNCGIHVHLGVTALGKTQSEREATLTKITWVYENFWDDIVKFSRRSNNRINEWACRYGQNGWNTIDRIVKSKGDGAGKYASINMSPMDTIEFRVFRGTLVSSSFDAIIDFVWGLLEGVKRMTMDEMEEECNYLTDFIAKDYLNDNLYSYMNSSGIGNLAIVAELDGADDMEDDA